MSYTKNISDDFCNYLDAQNQSANKMLKGCIQKNTIDMNNINDNKQTINTHGIEGFTNYGSGEFQLKEGVCPDGHTMDKNGCRSICTNCNYRDFEPESRSMNEYDICEPGHFSGFDKNGFVKCTGNINKKLPVLAYTADGSFLSNGIKKFNLFDILFS